MQSRARVLAATLAALLLTTSSEIISANASTQLLGPYLDLVVLDAQGNPVPDAEVTVLRDNSQLKTSYVGGEVVVTYGTTDSEGKFSRDLSSERPIAADHFDLLAATEYSYGIDYDIMVDMPVSTVSNPGAPGTYEDMRIVHYYADPDKIAARDSLTEYGEILSASEEEELDFLHAYTVTMEAALSTTFAAPSHVSPLAASRLALAPLAPNVASSPNAIIKSCSETTVTEPWVNVPTKIRTIHSSRDGEMISNFSINYGSSFVAQVIKGRGFQGSLNLQVVELDAGFVVKETSSAVGGEMWTIPYGSEANMSYDAEINLHYRKETKTYHKRLPWPWVKCPGATVTISPFRGSEERETDGVFGGQRRDGALPSFPPASIPPDDILTGQYGSGVYPFSNGPGTQVSYNANGIIEHAATIAMPGFSYDLSLQHTDSNAYTLEYTWANPQSGRTYILFDSRTLGQEGTRDEFWATYTEPRQRQTCSRTYGQLYPGNNWTDSLSTAFPSSLPTLSTLTHQQYYLTELDAKCGGCSRVEVISSYLSVGFQPRLLNMGVPDPMAAPYNVTRPSMLAVGLNHVFNYASPPPEPGQPATVRLVKDGRSADRNNDYIHLTPSRIGGESVSISMSQVEWPEVPPTLRNRVHYYRVAEHLDSEVEADAQEPDTALFGHTATTYAALLFGTQPKAWAMSRYVDYYIDDDDKEGECIFHQ